MSNADRQKRYRDSKRNAPKMLEHQDSAQIRGDRNAPEPESVTRVTPEPSVTRSRLVPIPGDADYVGCCKQVGGVWHIHNTKPDVKAMPTDELIRRLYYQEATA